MATNIKLGQLFGVISPILPDGEFVKCEPVFVDFWNSKNPSDYYLGAKSDLYEDAGILDFKKVDINVYGDKVFLPASRKKINDGKKYFIAFQPTKNYTKPSLQNYYVFPTIKLVDEPYYSRILSVGILFPNKFVAIISKRELSKKTLLSAIQQ